MTNRPVQDFNISVGFVSLIVCVMGRRARHRCAPTVPTCRHRNSWRSYLRNLANFLVHLFNRDGDADRTYLSVVHDRCLFCEEPINDSPSYLTYRVCPFCRFHYTVTARQRIELLADKGTFKESYKYVSSVEPLSFSRRGRYRKYLSQDQNRTGLTEAAVTGRCRIDDTEAMLIVLDFGFMGGTMGSVVGEKVSMALENAARRGLPAVAVVSGGGVRVQEGVLSLMQMAKTVTAANKLREAEVPFIVVLANPSTGQAYASFANLADVILAEPGSLIGLSPLRTLREVSKMPLPLDAHTAEAHVGHGLLDNVVDRENLRPRLAALLKILTAKKLAKTNHKALLKVESGECAEVEPWEAVTAARNSERPQATAYFRFMLDPFIELRGDRLNSDDRSIVAGLGFMDGEPVAVIGQQRRPLAEGERYHVYPDGLRKAQRVIDLASRFKLPLVTLIDTQGADPGLEAEEQGIGNAIARTLSSMLTVPTPVVSVVIGEGGSEGALALGLSDRILMQQYAIYSPISLNHTLGAAHHDHMLDREAAEALMLTALDCRELGIADEIVPEPEGGSHNDPREASSILQTAILTNITQLSKMSQGKLLKQRHNKFRRMGEGSGHSQEAMSREVELLMSITSGDAPPEAPARKRRRGRKQEEPVEAQISSDDD
ncbi:MAG: acetyl-CoA carboxylase carboxyl transferase subunit beta [SAR202 cluster bacterium]|nr:acetyl-CoA carboxylase carboxyl transferase subunit beta [SAR202 cluster bacterium]